MISTYRVGVLCEFWLSVGETLETLIQIEGHVHRPCLALKTYIMEDKPNVRIFDVSTSSVQRILHRVCSILWELHAHKCNGLLYRKGNGEMGHWPNNPFAVGAMDGPNGISRVQNTPTISRKNFIQDTGIFSA